MKIHAYAMIGELDYARRHLRALARHLTPKKIANIFLSEYERRRRVTYLRSRPVSLKVEATSLCQLHCPGCPWHQQPPRRPLPDKKSIGIDEFTSLLSPIADTLLGVSLSLRGDCLNNRDLRNMVCWCTEHNISTSFPTHFSYHFGDNEIENLVEAGLDHIMLAIDGTTQDVYEKYRVGGNLALVLENAKALIEARRRLKSRTPLIEWCFIMFEHNRHQHPEAKRMSRAMGFDRFTAINDHAQTMRREADKEKRSNNACFWPYRSTVIRSDGTMAPCCSDRFDMGNALRDGVLGVWNNEEYLALREVFSTGCPSTENGKKCAQCPWSPNTSSARSSRNPSI